MLSDGIISELAEMADEGDHPEQVQAKISQNKNQVIPPQNPASELPHQL